MEKYKYRHDWFITIQEKHLHLLSKLLIKALKFAETYTDIYDDDKRVINHSRKSLLFNNQQTLIKKECVLFDVTIGGIRRCRGM